MVCTVVVETPIDIYVVLPRSTPREVVEELANLGFGHTGMLGMRARLAGVLAKHGCRFVSARRVEKGDAAPHEKVVNA